MTPRIRHLATGILAAALMIAPVACSTDGDDADDAASVVAEETEPTNDEEGTDEEGQEPDGTDTETDGPVADPDGPVVDPDGPDAGSDGPAVVTPPEAQAFCDQLESMTDIDPQTLDEIRDAFGELDGTVPDDIREPYDQVMNSLSSASSIEELDSDTEAENALMAVSQYAASNCALG